MLHIIVLLNSENFKTSILLHQNNTYPIVLQLFDESLNPNIPTVKLEILTTIRIVVTRVLGFRVPKCLTKSENKICSQLVKG